MPINYSNLISLDVRNLPPKHIRLKIPELIEAVTVKSRLGKGTGRCEIPYYPAGFEKTEIYTGQITGKNLD